MGNIERNPAIIILAAGLGKRMKSRKAKVLHEILGIPMVVYVVDTAKKVAGNDVIVVIGNQAEKVRKVISESKRVVFVLQENQIGTGHAVKCALPCVPDHVRQVIILCGDVPMLTDDTINRFGCVIGIVEEADATEEQKKIKTINTGIYCVEKDFLFDSLEKIKSNNVQGEFYFTDIIGIGYKEGKNIGVVIETDFEEFMGINTRENLIEVENIIRRR
jgi:bifunctional N-acetylglucosamine-1-phosphate-uridyltransferase/glucosamine-1-phosphate-acetyltransferase GlmU-like protein